MAPLLLAVDDNRLVLEVVSDFFGPRGWEVLRAGEGVEALRALEAGPPAAIVCDILMPGMDGWAFYEEVRRRPELAEVPFVFLTIEAELPQRLRALHMGADDYIVKPFDVEELYARVERLVERRRALEEARRAGDALISGSVEHLAISDLLQILALNGKDGTVVLEQDESNGRIEFEAGKIVHAVSGRARGAKALYRMLGWTRATFRVLPRAGPAAEHTIDGAATNVLMDGLVSVDEWNRWADMLPPRVTSLRMTAEARARLEGKTLSPAEFEVLSRAKSGASVGAVLEESAQPDALVAEAIGTLLSRGILRAEG